MTKMLGEVNRHAGVSIRENIREGAANRELTITQSGALYLAQHKEVARSTAQRIKGSPIASLPVRNDAPFPTTGRAGVKIADSKASVRGIFCFWLHGFPLQIRSDKRLE
jgi:hypothetical protein